MQSEAASPRRLRPGSGKTWRSPDYLSFVRGRPCVVTGEEGERVVAHHVRCLGGGGMGLKPPDWMCLPMTSDQHAQLHAQGEASYWREHGEDPLALIAMTMLVYLAAHPSVELVEALGRIVEA